ncbi:AMP-dependent synthetase and ligase [Hesseltinella vesiculosa]|uniref:AMP-dependent synthetase and ligase n=1 Tax=Hesseltinella vesiculosa TaxID=101127 RepID=A0A1X2GKM6_9FUNG|nr:AMP-dependent synthetase and ligase [Hesseltinella vesiculosa]
MTTKAQNRLASLVAHLDSPNDGPFFDSLRLDRSPNDVPYLSPMDPLRFLLRSAMVYTNKEAVSHRDMVWTYRQFTERVQRLATGLLEEVHVQKGDRVGVLCNNVPAFLEAHYAIPASGAIIVPLNSRLAAAEIEYIIDHAGCSVLIVQDHLLPQVTNKVKAKVALLQVNDRPEDPSLDPYEQLLARQKPRLWRHMPLVNDELATLSINYTSGSTGRPKGVMATYRGCYLTSLNHCIQDSLTSSTVMLWTLPLFHCNGWCFPWAVVAVGGKHMLMNGIDYEYIWKCLKEKGVSHFNGAPTVQNEICNHPDAARLEKPVLVMSGGSALSSTLIKKMKALNIQPTQIYGLTEVHGAQTFTYEPWHQQLYYPGNEERQHEMLARQGFNAVVADEVRVLDQHGKDVPSDGQTIGEVCFSGNVNMKGYYDNPEETKKVFRHGYFWSGDLGVRHIDGVIEILDRSKDVIISGGENISSIEVESVIAQIPQVFECAVVGTPDDKWGERPFAFVILKENQALSEADVIAFCKTQLAGFKCPAKVSFVTSIPKTGTGKVQKYILRNGLWKDKTRKI